MTNDLAVSMDELERESAELLPSRETLCTWRGSSGGGHNVVNSFNQTNGNAVGGLIGISLLSGNNGSFNIL